MNTFVEIVEAGVKGQVQFYSLRIEDNDKTETQKFQEKYGLETKFSEDFGSLANILMEIGKRGAQVRYFRHEKNAHALPPKYLYSNRLRLYCLRVTDEIVVLGNGCFKDTRTAQESDFCRGPFNFMDRVSKAITKAIRERELQLQGGRLGGEMMLEI